MAVLNVNVTIPDFTGNSGAGGVNGLVPAPAAGDAAAGKYLHADGTWKPIGAGSVAQRTGSAIAFDSPAVYNEPTAPVSSSVTLDLSGAVAGTEVVAYFNHSSEPTWPAGVTAVGVWNNSQLNVVRFLFQDSSNISAAIISDANGSYTNPETIKLVDADVSTTGTTAVAIPDLDFNVLAGRTYILEVNLRVTGTASGGVKFGVYSTEADTAVRQRGIGNSSVSTAIANPALSTINALSAATISNSVSTDGFITTRGTVTGGALDSVVDIRFASATAGQNASVLSAGSYIKVTLA